MDTVKNEFVRLPETRLNWKESAERWSILECFEHLNRYSLYYHSQIAQSITKAVKIDTAIPETKSTWLGRKFISMMHPENVRKHRTYKKMNPRSYTLSVAVLAKFLQNQEELLGLIREASSVNLNEVSIPVEFMNLLRMNIGDALQFVVIHEKRHVHQAQRIRLKSEQTA